MTLAIYEDQGGDYDPDDYEPTALYDGDNWVAGGEKWEQYYPAGTSEEEIAQQLTGPSAVAVEVTGDPDAVLADIDKGQEPGEASMDVLTDRTNDSEEPPWAKSREKRSGVGPPMSSTLGVGDEATILDWGAEPSDEEEVDDEEE